MFCGQLRYIVRVLVNLLQDKSANLLPLIILRGSHVLDCQGYLYNCQV